MTASNANIFTGPTGTLPVVNAQGQLYEEVQVATAGQTVFTLATFAYTPGTRSIFVVKNGLELRRAVAYTETDNTHVTLATGATVGDVIIFKAFAVSQTLAPLQNNGVIPAGTSGQVLAKSSGSDYALQWLNLSSIATLLDQPVQAVASAPTVDVTPYATTTRNLLITGTTQIDGWQITAGEVFLVKFASSLSLSNNINQVTPTGAAIKVGPNDSCWVRATANNVVEILSYSKSTSVIPPQYNDHRLSLASGNPVPGDLTAQSTIYLTAYKGNNISLFNGTAWIVRQFTEINIALAALVSNKPYDVFCYDNAGTPTLELLAWTSISARATALVRQDGVYVKSGDATRKYIGSFLTSSTTQTNDSARLRHLWNMYNRVRRDGTVSDATASWVYSAAGLRQANGNIVNLVEFMVGVQEDTVCGELKARAGNSVNTGYSLSGIGYDSLTVIAGSTSVINTPFAGANVTHSSTARVQPAAGWHYMSWLEAGDGSGTMNWTGAGFAQLNVQLMA